MDCKDLLLSKSSSESPLGHLSFLHLLGVGFKLLNCPLVHPKVYRDSLDSIHIPSKLELELCHILAAACLVTVVFLTLVYHICAKCDTVFVVSTSIVFQLKSTSNLLLKFNHPNCKKATFFAFVTVLIPFLTLQYLPKKPGLPYLHILTKNCIFLKNYSDKVAQS